METNLAKISISSIISMKFMDKNTGEVLDEWNFDKCKNLNLEAEVAFYLDEVEKSKIFDVTIED